MPSERKIPPTTRRIKTTAFGALLRIIFIGEFVFSYRPHSQPKVTKFTAQTPRCEKRETSNNQHRTPNIQWSKRWAQSLDVRCWLLDVFFLRLRILAFENYLTADASDRAR